MKKILIAVDGSDCSFRAVEYCAELFSGVKNVGFTIFHVFTYTPPHIWQFNRILKEEKNGFDSWLKNQKQGAESIVKKAEDILHKSGFGSEQIETKIVSDSTNVAGSILEEAKNGYYVSLVLGRQGSHHIKELFLGSTTSRIINRGVGLAIWVVE